MKKTVLWFGGAAVLLALVLIVVKVEERGTSLLNPEGFVFDTAQVSEVVWLRVIYQNDTAELERKGSDWVGVRTGEPARTERVQRALTGLLGIRSLEKVSESNDPVRLDEFGIGAADAKQVDWKLTSGEKFRVLLGKISGTDFNSTYWKWDDKAGVYRTPGDFTFDLASQETEWKVDGAKPAFEVK
jgi:hypothetical protein